MKGKMTRIMKRWWKTALVFTLALSLTSCAKKKPDLMSASYGYTQCDGNLGTFDVYVMRDTNGDGNYQIAIMPVQVEQNGDIATVAIGNSAPSYQVILPQVVLNDGQEIDASGITAEELSTYNVLGITPFDGTTAWSQQSPVASAYCQLPGLGDGIQPQNLMPIPQY